MAHHLSYLLLSPAAIHLAFWPPDCGRFHPLHPLFAPNRVAQADHGMPENPKQHFCVPEECVEGVGTSPSTSKISPAPPTTSPSETAYDTALRSCLRRAELGVVFDRVINPGSSSTPAYFKAGSTSTHPLPKPTGEVSRQDSAAPPTSMTAPGRASVVSLNSNNAKNAMTKALARHGRTPQVAAERASILSGRVELRVVTDADESGAVAEAEAKIGTLVERWNEAVRGSPKPSRSGTGASTPAAPSAG